MRVTIREWCVHQRSDKCLEDLARMCNPVMRGWINYFRNYCKSAMRPTLDHLDRILVRWAMRKYKKLKKHQRRACQWLKRIQLKQPGLFVHWQFLHARAGR